MNTRLKQFLIAETIILIGVSGDYTTSVIGLNMGFVETHPQYSPLNAIIIYTAVNTILTILDDSWRWQALRLLIASSSWLGMINNLTWLLGSSPIFRGERILDEFKEAAHTIIDMVEMAIRKAHPEIDKYASKLEGNTLLHGEAYYNLESEIADMLRERSFEDARHLGFGFFEAKLPNGNTINFDAGGAMHQAPKPIYGWTRLRGDAKGWGYPYEKVIQRLTEILEKGIKPEETE